jgi:hypothetical protein
MKDFKKLLNWQQGMKVAGNIYAIILNLTVEEKPGMHVMIIRSATAIPANGRTKIVILIEEVLDMITSEQKMLTKFIEKVGG